MDYTHLDEQIRFLIAAGVDKFSGLYQVIGRDELEKYRTSSMEESSRPLFRRLESICKYDIRYRCWKNIDYEPKNYLSKMALDHLESEIKYKEDYEDDDSTIGIIKKSIREGEILYDESIGSYRPNDDEFESIGMAYLWNNRGVSLSGVEKLNSEVAEFVYKVLERKGAISYDKAKDKWVVSGLNPDYTWLDNMIVLKVTQGYGRTKELWSILGDDINKRYPFIWKWHRHEEPGLMLMSDRVLSLLQSRKLMVDPVTRALKFPVLVGVK